MRNAYFMFYVLLFVHGSFAVEEKTEHLEITEGDSVALVCCVTKIEKDDVLEWKFNSTVIATINANKALLYDTDDALFKDRLQINEQTGELTIRNTRTKHSGVYEVTVISKQPPTSKRFNVTVFNPMPKKESVTEGASVILEHDIQNYGKIEWKFEGQKIAELNKQQGETPLYHGDKFKGRLQLNINGFLTINNTKATDSGLYQLEAIGTNIVMKVRTFRVEVTESGLSTGAIVLGCVIGSVVFLIVSICIYCTKRKKHSTVI